MQSWLKHRMPKPGVNFTAFPLTNPWSTDRRPKTTHAALLNHPSNYENRRTALLGICNIRPGCDAAVDQLPPPHLAGRQGLRKASAARVFANIRTAALRSGKTGSARHPWTQTRQIQVKPFENRGDRHFLTPHFLTPQFLKSPTAP